jgi:hypothetical protein
MGESGIDFRVGLQGTEDDGADESEEEDEEIPEDLAHLCVTHCTAPDCHLPATLPFFSGCGAVLCCAESSEQLI